MALTLEKFLFSVIIQTMMLTTSWFLLSILLPSSDFLLTVCASSCTCSHNKPERLTLLKCTVQHLWKNPLKSTGTRRGGLLLAAMQSPGRESFSYAQQFSLSFPVAGKGWIQGLDGLD